MPNAGSAMTTSSAVAMTAETAGRTVTEPIIATATTMIEPMPSAVKMLRPAKNIPAMAIITVEPATSTARPELADEDAGVGGLDVVDRGRGGADEVLRRVLIALQREVDAHGAAVPGDLALVALRVGRLDLGHAGLGRDGGD